MIAKCPNPPKDNEKRRKQIRFNEKVIMHATIEKITVTKRYMHLWNECIAMTNVQVKVFVKVCNRTIGFYIWEQRAT